MRAPAFWWRPERTAAATLLAPLGHVAGGYAAARLAREGRSAEVPVICVGNPTVGGAGKTPTAILVATRLFAMGRRPAFLTRGYGGTVRGPVVVAPGHHGAEQVGDEPLLLARTAPTIVARDRVVAALGAGRLGADVLVMDDGFQNPALNKTLSLLVIDAAVGVGNGLCLPAGPLRAPLGPQFARAGALVLIGDGGAGEWVAHEAETSGLTVLRGRLAPDAAAVARLMGRRLLAFAGIGRPSKFFDTLQSVGIRPARTRGFPDHHAYSLAELSALRDEALRDDLTLVTTEKDAARLAASEAGQILMRQTEVLPVRLVPDDAAAFDRLLARALEAQAAR